MIAALFEGLLERLVARGWKSWQAKLAVFGGLVLLAVLLVGLAVGVIFHRGEKHEHAKNEVKTVKAHAAAVAGARVDERKIGATGAAIGADVARKNDATTTFAKSKATEIHNAIASAPSIPAGSPAPAPVFDGGRLRASLDALDDRANRAADFADAQP